MSCGILLNMSTNLQELMPLLQMGDFDNNITVAESVPPELFALGIRLDDNNGYPIYVAPRRPLELVEDLQQEFPEESLAYLSLARRQWANGDAQSARASIAEGVTFAEDRTQFMVSAALSADSEDDTEAALVYAILALHSTLENPAIFEQLRPMAGEFVYEMAGKLNLTNLDNLINQIIGSRTFTVENGLTASPILVFAETRNRIANGNDLLALRSLRSVEDLTRLQPEFALLRAELELLRENPQQARQTLNAILENDVPAWVEDRAGDLLNELD
jgi:hypothetical protein